MTSPALAAPPQAEITPDAARDLLWLETRLGRRRFGGWREVDGGFEVELVRSNGKRVWCYGATLEIVAARARAVVAQGVRS